MRPLSFHDKKPLWHSLLPGASRRSKSAATYTVYSYEKQTGRWKKHDRINAREDAIHFARMLLDSGSFEKVEIKKNVLDPQTGKTIELDFKILN